MNLQIATAAPGLPTETDIAGWVDAVLAGRDAAGLVTIRVVDEEESKALNGDYRDKPEATNVLAFPADSALLSNAANDEQELGDLAICFGVVAREAQQQSKAFDAHFAHMAVHGTLHLLGYDHLNTADAEKMESLETNIMQELGFPDPYTI